MDITSFLLGLQKGKANFNKDDISYTVVTATITGAGEEQIVTHGCGVVPDIIIINTIAVPSANNIYFAIGANAAMVSRMSSDYFSNVRVLFESGGAMSARSSKGIESSDPENLDYGGIRSATASQFTIGNSNYYLENGQYYNATYIYGIT